MYSCSLAAGRTEVISLGAAASGNSARTTNAGASASIATASNAASSAPATTPVLLLIIDVCDRAPALPAPASREGIIGADYFGASIEVLAPSGSPPGQQQTSSSLVVVAQ